MVEKWIAHYKIMIKKDWKDFIHKLVTEMTYQDDQEQKEA